MTYTVPGRTVSQAVGWHWGRSGAGLGVPVLVGRWSVSSSCFWRVLAAAGGTGAWWSGDIQEKPGGTSGRGCVRAGVFMRQGT